MKVPLYDGEKTLLSSDPFWNIASWKFLTAYDNKIREECNRSRTYHLYSKAQKCVFLSRITVPSLIVSRGSMRTAQAYTVSEHPNSGSQHFPPYRSSAPLKVPLPIIKVLGPVQGQLSPSPSSLVCAQFPDAPHPDNSHAKPRYQPIGLRMGLVARSHGTLTVGVGVAG